MGRGAEEGGWSVEVVFAGCQWEGGRSGQTWVDLGDSKNGRGIIFFWWWAEVDWARGGWAVFVCWGVVGLGQ